MSYWCAEQLVVTIEGPTGRSVVSLSQPFARIGSHEGADVVLADQSIATRSLYLHATAEGIFCLYLDVAAHDLDEKGKWLQPDDEVPVGPYRLRASLLSADSDDPIPNQDPTAWGSAAPPLPVMTVYCGELLKDKRRFRARLSAVGRRPQCALQLKGKKVSSFHCVLYWEEQQLWCIDLCSSNGTQLNQRPIVCDKVSVGDRLDVGEFSLLFHRLSRGGSRDSAKVAAERAPLPAASEIEPTPLPATGADPTREPRRGPTPEELAREDEDRKLREQLAEEVARLGRERQEMQARWESSSQQLQEQIGHLHDESARLSAERQALEQSRSQWHGERAQLTQQLSERADQLTRLEAELLSATASLQQKMAEVEQRALEPPSPPSSATAATEPEVVPLDDFVFDQLAPAALIAGIEPESPEAIRQPLIPEVAWTYLPADLASEASAPPDPQIEFQKHWEETTRQLSAQVEQLRAEAAQLAAERQAQIQSRDQWQEDRSSQTEELAARQQALTRQQAELSAATSSLAAKLTAVEHQVQSSAQTATPVKVKPTLQVAADEPEFDLSPPASDTEVNTLKPALVEPALGNKPDEDKRAAILPEVSAAEAEPFFAHAPLVDINTTRPGPVGVTDLADRDELRTLVSNRLILHEGADGWPSWVWWLAGGLAAVALIAVVTTIILWAR